MLGPISNIACWCGAAGSVPGMQVQFGSSDRAQFTLIDDPWMLKSRIAWVKSSGRSLLSSMPRKVRLGSRLLATSRRRGTAATSSRSGGRT